MHQSAEPLLIFGYRKGAELLRIVCNLDPLRTVLLPQELLAVEASARAELLLDSYQDPVSRKMAIPMHVGPQQGVLLWQQQ